MPDITFILADGSERGLEAPEGVSVMAAATGAGVPGIVAECGGSCVCATCHVYVDPERLAALPPPSEDELELLEDVKAERKPNSRLSCQIKANESLAGLVVTIPECQT